MGFSNIAKYKYSWVLNRMGCVHWAHRSSFGLNYIMIKKCIRYEFFGIFVIVYIMAQFR